MKAHDQQELQTDEQWSARVHVALVDRFLTATFVYKAAANSLLGRFSRQGVCVVVVAIVTQFNFVINAKVLRCRQLFSHVCLGSSMSFTSAFASRGFFLAEPLLYIGLVNLFTALLGGVLLHSGALLRGDVSDRR